MIRVAVIDDEPLARSGVIARIASYPDLQVVAEYENGPDALQGIVTLQPELVFIDIEMPGMNGLDVLAQLTPQDRPMAILLTAYANFALRAFELNVIDYLLKPIDDDRLIESIERVRCALPYRSNNRANKQPPDSVSTKFAETLTVRIGNRILLVNVVDIVWIAADGDYVTLYVGARQYLVREPIHRLLQRLDPEQFVRIHRSTITKIDQISELRLLSNRDALIRLHDGTPLRVSRSYIDNLLQSLQRVRGCDLIK